MTRPIEEIYRELAAHPDFVIGNYLSRQHVEDAGFDLDDLPQSFADDNADMLSEAMLDALLDAELALVWGACSHE